MRRAGTTQPPQRERGAAMVEFAIVGLLFITLLFGIMEAGWAFSQSVEIRNAAREGGRIAVVDYGSASAIAAEVCDRAAISAPGSSVAVVLLPSEGDPESVQVTVSKPYSALTGLLPFFNDFTISSDVEMRVERELVNLVANGSGTCS